ncbi:MAG: carbamoyltransferase [Spirochaetaceae bacterium]|nr:carbamoyltransferase [Spirochaetaceae bacterium]
MDTVYILGISAYYHDSAACILKNGEIIAAAQEERFSRKKGDSRFPSSAVSYCLDEASVSIDQVEHIVFYDKPILKFDRILASYIHRAPWGVRSFLQSIPLWLKSKLWVESNIQKELGTKKQILFTEHHQSHSASAFFPSPFNDAVIVTIDGVGEWATTTIGVGDGNKLELLKKINFPHSLGLLYSSFTYYCGFRVNSGEYKLMGLAPYGKPAYLDLIKRELIEIESDGSFRLNMKYFDYMSGLKMINRKFEKLFAMPALKADEEPSQFYRDIAASIQALFNEVLLKIALHAKELTGRKNLCLAGGVALNCVANGEIFRKAGFSQVWIQPAAGDAGGALGAAFYAHFTYLKNERVPVAGKDSQKGSYLGPGFSEESIKNVLDSYDAKYVHYNDDTLIEYIVGQIDRQKAVGFFQGRSEFGPRALGNRSILGDPRSPEMQKNLNLKIKFRESFRPFAPSVLEEHSRDYFDEPSRSPYMLFTTQVQQDKLLPSDSSHKKFLEILAERRSEIPAVTHVDNSARIQTVSEEDNRKYYRVIKRFYEKTGCPLLINTSFNVRGEPIVNDPSHAYACFMGSNIDVLVLGNYVLLKEDQPPFKERKKWQKTLIRD